MYHTYKEKAISTDPHVLGCVTFAPFMNVHPPVHTPTLNIPTSALPQTVNTGRNFPPYNIIRFKDGSCRLDLAVAGYTKDRLSVELEENTLIIKGLPQTGEEADVDAVVKQGIANNAWVRTFEMEAGTKIDNVELHEGILGISVSVLVKKLARTSFEIK